MKIPSLWVLWIFNENFKSRSTLNFIELLKNFVTHKLKLYFGYSTYTKKVTHHNVFLGIGRSRGVINTRRVKYFPRITFPPRLRLTCKSNSHSIWKLISRSKESALQRLWYSSNTIRTSCNTSKGEINFNTVLFYPR